MHNDLVSLFIKDTIIIQWKDKDAWLGIQVAENLGYENPSKIVNYFINSDEEVKDEDFEIFKGEELKELKFILENKGISKYKQSPKLLLFYKKSFIRFLKYRGKFNELDIEKILSSREVKGNNILSTYNIKESIVNSFQGKKVYTFFWKNKPCWIAIEIASIFNYENPSKTITQCIKSEEFEKGYEYDILSGDELDKFKELTTFTGATSLKHTPKLTIFYEDGLYGFLQYSEKPIGIQFRKWLRRDVLPKLRETGTYSLKENENKDFSNNKNLVNYNLDNIIDNDIDNFIKLEDNFKKMKLTYESITLFKEIFDSLNIESYEKLKHFESIYKNLGIQLFEVNTK